jgi:transcriptional regulator with XRE-family HTH domain
MEEAANKIREAFAHRLAVARESYAQRVGQPGMTAGEFAKLLGLDAERYRKYERGEREPPFWVLAKIASLTGFGPDFLILGAPPSRAA